jgi:hypothetical protein
LDLQVLDPYGMIAIAIVTIEETEAAATAQVTVVSAVVA